MSRTFIYSFTPPSLDPAPGATIELDVSEIEDAGIREGEWTEHGGHAGRFLFATVSRPSRTAALVTATR
jgi:hypothetical protein